MRAQSWRRTKENVDTKEFLSDLEKQDRIECTDLEGA